MNGGRQDEELADDLVGVASARLLSLGVPRGERLRALRLLSVLATLADADGRVRRPLAMVASEFDLPPEAVELWFDDLVAIGVVRMDGDAVVLGGREPVRGVGITLHDFLDAAAELDARPPARPRWSTALLRPSSAVLAAAAVIAVALVAPRVVGDDGSAPASSTRTPMAPEVATTADEAPSSPTGTVRPATSVPVTEPVDGGERIGPVLVPTTSTTLLPCPVDVPALEVLGTTTAADGRLAVDGVARNTSGQALQIESFTLRTSIGGQEISVPGLIRPLVVPPGGEVLWQSLLPALAPPGTSVRVTLGDWEWLGLDDGLVCPSP